MITFCNLDDRESLPTFGTHFNKTVTSVMSLLLEYTCQALMCQKNFHAVQNYLCFFRLKLILFLYTGMTSFVARQELIARIGKLLHCNGSAVSKSSLFCTCLTYTLAEGPMKSFMSVQPYVCDSVFPGIVCCFCLKLACFRAVSGIKGHSPVFLFLFFFFNFPVIGAKNDLLSFLKTC